jgi:hypothetical protein
MGSARVSRVSFDVAPKRSFLMLRDGILARPLRKVRDREDALARTRAMRYPACPICRSIFSVGLRYALLAGVGLIVSRRGYDRFFAWYQLVTLLIWALVVRRVLVGNAMT